MLACFFSVSGKKTEVVIEQLELLHVGLSILVALRLVV